MKSIKNYYLLTMLVLLSHFMLMNNFFVSDAEGFTGKFNKVSEKQIGILKGYEFVFEVDTWYKGEKIKQVRTVFSPIKIGSFKPGKKYNIYIRKNWLIKSNMNT